MEPQLELIEQSFDEHYSNWVYEALDELPDNFTITDPCICGHPIVFASRGCLRMFGYSKEEVVGRNGRMFQGQGTCRRTVMQIREAIREERSIEVSLLNYRKDGTPFWMLFRMSPVFSEEDGKAINFVAVQVPILRKPRHSRSEQGQNMFCLCEDGFTREMLLGTCRREVCLDSVAGSNRCTALDAVLDTKKGYARHEVLARRHRFLSGADTDSRTLLQIDECIQNGKPCKVLVLDFRKDMTSFWNQLHISPIRNASGKIAYFIEVHMEEDSSNVQDGRKLNPEMRQLGAIAMAKVAVRSATMVPGSSS